MPKTLPIHFAPLQGYTEVFYRNAHAACFGGIDTYYTPFVRLEKGGFRHRDVRGIEPGNNQVAHLIPQLIAPSFEKAEKILSLFIEKGYKEVDINIGCPFPMLAKRHNGSGILPYPEEVQALLSLITEYPQISFSIKMRLGWEDQLTTTARQQPAIELFKQLHTSPWEKDVQLTPHFTLRKVETDVNKWVENRERTMSNINDSVTNAESPALNLSFNLIYFDAFAPEKQPEMWSQELFNRLYVLLDRDGILTTYCAKGVVRRMLQTAGFTVERLPGPPGGKREILRARK